ncbi:MAG: OmpA family protein [Moraxella sp.]|uniref:OmpA family protein n=1 Tax=Moraxella sp. TaxID=479 RepID=UPI0026DC532D|nr:OmpA family protein [Moraxella sp.]MDO4450557.1 OmpA family protein [Moraxella sp.]
MKLNKITLAVLATVATAASAGVTVTPLVGYQYQDEAHDKQRGVFHTGKQLNNTANPSDTANPRNGGVALESDLYTGLALGVELTPATQFQVEYGITDTEAKASKHSASLDPANTFDAKEEIISGNFLIGLDQFTGYTNSKFKPYVLIGGGQAKYSVENQVAYNTLALANSANGAGELVPAGTEVAESKDTIGNIGLGARYLINDALAVRGEVRGVHNFDNEWWEGQALAGLEVTLGGRLGKAAPAVVAPVVEPVAPVQIIEDVVVDSDMDGVADHLDACPGTPRNVVVDARGCPVERQISEELRMELRVFFDRDKSNIKPQFREEVAKVAEKMREFPNATAAIEGHASKDSKRSNARYNQRLSEARANAVKSMLSNEFGIAPNRLSAVGYGFDRPIAPNDTNENKALNRRVYAVIQGAKVTSVVETK